MDNLCSAPVRFRLRLVRTVVVLVVAAVVVDVVYNVPAGAADDTGGGHAVTAAPTPLSFLRLANSEAISFLASKLRPYLRDAMSSSEVFRNATKDSVVAWRRDVDRLVGASSVVAHADVANGHSSSASNAPLPWFAQQRRVDGNQRHFDFATATALVDSLMSHLLASNRLGDAGENITFATNTADKFMYQLRNFEPMTHRFSSPQWNGISLEAQRRIGVKQPRGFLIGLSTVNRMTNYLVSTLVSFLTALNTEEERRLVHFIVFNGDYPPQRHDDIVAAKVQLAAELSVGLIEIVELDRSHPQLTDPSKLARRWGDDLERVKWRSKQVLDVAFLMEYASKYHLGYDYFLMMEDDIIASKNFARRLRSWLDAHLLQKTDWTMLSFYNPWEVHDLEQLPPHKFFGVIGQLFRVHDLPVIVEFLRKNFDQSPLDWLFVDLLKKIGGSIVVHTPSLFQHQGTVSSLAGKSQQGQSVDFREAE